MQKMQVDFFEYDDDERLTRGRRYYNGPIYGLIEWVAERLREQGYDDEAIAFEVRMKRKHTPQSLPVYPNDALAKYNDEIKMNIAHQYVSPDQVAQWIVSKLTAQGYVDEAIQFKIRQNMVETQHLPFTDIQKLIQSNEVGSYQVESQGETTITIETINGNFYSGRVIYDSTTDKIYPPRLLTLPSLQSPSYNYS